MAADDTDDLRDRVADLEATVQAQQDTIRKMLPGRRQVLQAGGLVAGGGVLGALTADRAAADVVGQVGTQQDRVDVFAGAVDANSVNTPQLEINVPAGGAGYLDYVVNGSSRFQAGYDDNIDHWYLFDVEDGDTVFEINRGAGEEIELRRPTTAPELSVDSAATKIYPATNQTIPANDWTTLAFDTVDFDSLGIADTANNQVVVESEGTYQITVMVEWQGDADWGGSEVLNLRLVINGQNRYIHQDRKQFNGLQTQATPAQPFEVSSGDSVSAQVKQLDPEGDSHDITGSALTTALSVVRVG